MTPNTTSEWQTTFHKRFTHGKFEGDVGSSVISVDSAQEIKEFIASLLQLQRTELLGNFHKAVLKHLAPNGGDVWDGSKISLRDLELILAQLQKEI